MTDLNETLAQYVSKDDDVVRPKHKETPWAQCSPTEQTERLREILRDHQRRLSWTQERLSQLEQEVRRLHHHQHGQDGTVLIRSRDIEPGYGLVETAAPLFDPLA